jgi:hypothetical protein
LVEYAEEKKVEEEEKKRRRDINSPNASDVSSSS